METSTMIVLCVILAILVWAAISGFRIGIFKQLGSIAGIIIAAIACHLFGAQVAAMFVDSASGADQAAATTLLVYVVFYLVVYFAVYFFGGMLSSLFRSLHLGGIDKALGSVFRVIVWLVMISVILNLATAIMPDMPFCQQPAISALISLGRTVMGANPSELIHMLGIS